MNVRFRFGINVIVEKVPEWFFVTVGGSTDMPEERFIKLKILLKHSRML